MKTSVAVGLGLAALCACGTPQVSSTSGEAATTPEAVRCGSASGTLTQRIWNLATFMPRHFRPSQPAPDEEFFRVR